MQDNYHGRHTVVRVLCAQTTQAQYAKRVRAPSCVLALLEAAIVVRAHDALDSAVVLYSTDSVHVQY